MAKLTTKMYAPADICSVSYGGVTVDIEVDDEGRRYVDVPLNAVEDLKAHGLTTEEPKAAIRKIEKDAHAKESDRLEKPLQLRSKSKSKSRKAA